MRSEGLVLLKAKPGGWTECPMPPGVGSGGPRSLRALGSLVARGPRRGAARQEEGRARAG